MSTLAPPIDAAIREEIRTNLDESLCVEAGAGTGKTTSLVDRIVEILASGRADVDSLAVITFTEKAAAELSTRVREEIDAAIPGETDPDRRRRLVAAGAGLYRARLETIHTFAMKSLQERPVEAGVDPGFAVMGELEATLSFDAAYNDWRDDLMAGDHPEVERALNVGFGLDELRETAERLHRERFLLPLAGFRMPSPDAGELTRWLAEHVDRLEAYESSCTDPDDKGLPGLHKVIRFAHLCAEQALSDSARERLVAVAAPQISPNKGKAGSWPDGDCKAMKALLKDYCEMRERLRDALRTVALLGVLPHAARFVADYEAVRRADGVADFDDLLIWARNLLRDNLDVRRYFQRRFACLLIDEFQDTDPIQVEMAAYLTSDDQDGTDWRALRPAPGKLFVVGDPKQAIYRFRRADLAIYDEVKRGLLEPGLRQIVQNFRSGSGVIDWVNEVFDALLLEEPGIQPPNVPLTPASGDLEIGRPPVIVLRGGDSELNADGVREHEARGVARLLHQAVVTETWPVRDRVTEEVRLATWRDIAILLPARTGLGSYEDALALAGIPHRHEGSRDYFERQEVRDLVLMLQAIDDPIDRFSLVGALRSSAFGCSDEDLVVHKATGGAFDYRPDAPSQSPAVMDAFELLRKLHRSRGRTSLPELVQHTVEESRLVEFALTLPDGPQAAANLLAIVDQARAFTAAGGGGLRAYTRYLAKSTEEEATEVDAGIAEETDDVVRLLTMHGSKGLEFPIVVLANLSSGIRSAREPVPDEASRRLHFRVGSDGRTGHYATPGYDERWDGEKAALEAERIRLLYVAATRARDHLIVPWFEGKRRPGPFMTALEPLLPEQHGHEMAVDGTWLLEADELPPAPEVAEAPSADVEPEVVTRATDERAAWSDEHEELLRSARQELETTVASSVERAVRPMAAEASHSASTLLVSEGPPLPIGDALHLVMERVALPGAENLDEVVAAVCAEAGLPEDTGLVGEMASRCIGSEAMRRALASEAWYREVPFTIGANGGYRTGRVDLVYRDVDELVIVDFKTDDVSGDREAHEGFTLEHHAGQAEVYTEALEKATGLAVREVVFVYCRTGVEAAVRS